MPHCEQHFARAIPVRKREQPDGSLDIGSRIGCQISAITIVTTYCQALPACPKPRRRLCLPLAVAQRRCRPAERSRRKLLATRSGLALLQPLQRCGQSGFQFAHCSPIAAHGPPMMPNVSASSATTMAAPSAAKCAAAWPAALQVREQYRKQNAGDSSSNISTANTINSITTAAKAILAHVRLVTRLLGASGTRVALIVASARSCNEKVCDVMGCGATDGRL